MVLKALDQGIIKLVYSPSLQLTYYMYLDKTHLLWGSASPSMKWGSWTKMIFEILSRCKYLWFLEIMHILKIGVWNQTSQLVVNICDPRCHGHKSGICGWSCYSPNSLDANVLEPSDKMGASIVKNNKVGTTWVLSGLHFQHYLARKDEV